MNRIAINYICNPQGELAQLVERLHGMQEVSGSNPLFSTSMIKSSAVRQNFFYEVMLHYKGNDE